MSDETEEPSDEESGETSVSSDSTGITVDLDVSGILAAQKVAEEAIQPAAVESIIQVQKAMEQTVKPALLRDAIEMQKIAEEAVQPALARDMVQMQKIAENAVTPALAQSAIQVQKIADTALQPAMVQSLVELEQVLNSALVQLNAQSITADVSTITATAHQKSPTPIVGQYKYPATDIDEIRPPESRIHDKLIWDDGEWYRRRTQELSFYLVDYIFWKAQQTGDLTDASDEEIGLGATAAAFFITLAFTWNPVASVTVAGATGGTALMGSKAARKRTERKSLEETFNGDE